MKKRTKPEISKLRSENSKKMWIERRIKNKSQSEVQIHKRIDRIEERLEILEKNKLHQRIRETTRKMKRKNKLKKKENFKNKIREFELELEKIKN